MASQGLPASLLAVCRCSGTRTRAGGLQASLGARLPYGGHGVPHTQNSCTGIGFVPLSMDYADYSNATLWKTTILPPQHRAATTTCPADAPSAWTLRATAPAWALCVAAVPCKGGIQGAQWPQ